MHDKRGEAQMIINWLVAGSILTVVCLVLVFMVAPLASRTVDTSEIEPEIYLAKLYYSPHMINSVDRASQVTRTGVIDLQRFDRIEHSNIGGDLAAKLTLHNPVGDVVRGPVYDGEQTYRRYESLASNQVGGLGSAKITTFVMPVLYEDNGLHQGKLHITIVRLNK